MQTHFINGQWVAGEGHDVQSIDPAKNTVIWQGKSASTEQVDAAIDAARSASESWSALSVEQRLTYIDAFAEALTVAKPLFTQVIAEETGKPLWETATEAAAMVGKVGLSKKSYYERTDRKSVV